MTRADRAAALSTPMKAQKMMASEAGTLLDSDAPDGLQEATKMAGSKAMAPATTATATGARPMIRARAAKRAAVRAPMI